MTGAHARPTAIRLAGARELGPGPPPFPAYFPFSGGGFSSSGFAPSLCSLSVIEKTVLPASSVAILTGGPGSFFANHIRTVAPASRFCTV